MPLAVRRTHVNGRAALFGLLLASSCGFPGTRAKQEFPEINQSQAALAGIEVEAALASDLRDGAEPFLVYFRDRPDLSPALSMEWEARGRFVVDALRGAAEESQKRVRGELERQGISYKAFWIDNVIAVERGTSATVNSLLYFDEIRSIQAERVLGLIEPDEKLAGPRLVPMTVEPSLEQVDADDVWNLGVDGTGVVVGSIDTGARFTHEALVQRYRGNLGNGSFSHDFNWWDPYGVYDEPTDNNGHGSHTIGTMVGADSAGVNQIGMAPGAKWIACRGCSTSSCGGAQLLECAQWIAAPWDLARGEPDPSRRPLAVNNSWGDCRRAYDGWYQNVVDAWHAAGIHPLFANGNASNCGYASPPGCNTVGNPGRYGNVTGVGSTGQANGQYANHSNWGPTDNTDPVNGGAFPNIKPQVVAPGVSIRSATRDSDSSYASWSGTSMSTPHVTGLAALIYQAAPCLIGQYAEVERILQETATPKPYATSCGGEGTGNQPNNATGWGEINALAAVNAATAFCGPTGSLQGHITNPSGQPISGVKVVAAGRTATTDAAGYYRIDYLQEGTHTASASHLLHYDGSANVEIVVEMVTTRDFTLVPRPAAVMSGVVTDGNGHGWPLYARISATAGGGTLSTYTDPFTGAYSLTLLRDSTFTVTVQPVWPGYRQVVRAVTPDTAAYTEDFALAAANCDAAGFQPIPPIWSEGFEADDGGFTVVPVAGTPSWAWGAPTSGPGSARGGAKAWATNLSGNYNDDEQSYLVSPAIDLSAAQGQSLVLSWWQYLRTESGYDFASVEVSKDDGATWARVYGTVSGSINTSWAKKEVELDSSHAVSGFRVRFRFAADYSVTFPGWYLDDLAIGTTQCDITPAGAVMGFVTSLEDGSGIVGATVGDGTGLQATTLATPNDPAVSDGIYFFVRPPGTAEVSAKKANYSTDTAVVEIVADAVGRQDFVLGAGRLSVAPTSFTLLLRTGQQETRQFVLSNSGTGPVEFRILEQAWGGPQYVATPQAYPGRLVRPASGAAYVRHDGASPAIDWGSGQEIPTGPRYRAAGVQCNGQLFVLGGFNANNVALAEVWRLDPIQGTWQRRADMPVPSANMGGACVEGRIYLVGSSDGAEFRNDFQIYELASNTWVRTTWPSATTPMAVGHKGMLYAFGGVDGGLLADAWQFNPALGSWIRLADMPTATAFGAALSVGNHIYVIGGPGVTEVQRFFPPNNTWDAAGPKLPSFRLSPVGAWFGDRIFLVSGGGLNGENWSPHPGTLTYEYGKWPGGSWLSAGDSVPSPAVGAAGDCVSNSVWAVGGAADASVFSATRRLGDGKTCSLFSDIAWLSTSPSEGIIPVDGTQVVTLALDSTSLQPANYHAKLRLQHDTPYATPDVEVTLKVGHVIGVQQAPHGTIDPDGDTVVEVGGEATYILTAAPGFHTRHILIDGIAHPPAESFTFSDVRDSHLISALFVADCVSDSDCTNPANDCLGRCVEDPGGMSCDFDLPKVRFSSCNADDNGCTAGDYCSGGYCVPGGAPDCSGEADACNAAACQSTGADSYACVKNPAPREGWSCNADSNGCTVNDRCEAGSCRPGAGPDCSATADQCNAGVCQSTGDFTYACVRDPALRDGQSCDADGNGCTVGDTCQSGTCRAGAPASCVAAADQCNSGVCRSTGSSTFECDRDPAPHEGRLCNADGNGCTVADRCVAGGCVPGPTPDCSWAGDQCNDGLCQSTADHAYACVKNPAPHENQPCNADSSGCTVNDSCRAGTCRPGAPADCSGEADQCNAAACQPTGPESYVCVKDPSAREGQLCDADSDGCTVGDRCLAGACAAGAPPDCSAASDQCNTGACQSTGAHGYACVRNPSPHEGHACNADSSGCTADDTCLGGICRVGVRVDCSAAGDACNAGVCQSTGEDAFECVKDPAPKEGLACNADSDGCTVNDRCESGACLAGAAPDCSATGDQCNVGECRSTGDHTYACARNPAPLEAAPCDADSSGCTVDDRCEAGTCRPGAAPDCSAAGDACNSGVCESTGPDGYVCARDPAPHEGRLCDADGDGCSVADACRSGTCTPGEPPDCSSADDPCNVGECRSTGTHAYVCVKNPDAREGELCDADSSGCTVGDACRAGSCLAGAPADCAAQDDACNIGVCVSTGAHGYECVPDATRHQGRGCDADGNGCTVNDRCFDGVCFAGAAPDCSALDGACATGSCHPTGEDTYACVRVFEAHEGLACDGDADGCTADACASGRCVVGPPVDCSGADDACNAGLCVSTGGLSFTCEKDPSAKQGLSCLGDGETCAGGGTCADGQCVPDEQVACDDGVTCTVDRCVAESGTCASTPDDGACVDRSGCRSGRCDPEEGCVFASREDWTPCEVEAGAAARACFSGACERVPDGDTCEGAREVSAGAVVFASFDGMHAFRDASESCGSAVMPGADAFYSLRVSAGRTYRVTVIPAAELDVALVGWSGCAEEDACLQVIDQAEPGASETFTATAPDDGVLVVQVIGHLEEVREKQYRLLVEDLTEGEDGTDGGSADGGADGGRPEDDFVDPVCGGCASGPASGASFLLFALGLASLLRRRSRRTA